jgi:protein TonB
VAAPTPELAAAAAPELNAEPEAASAVNRQPSKPEPKVQAEPRPFTAPVIALRPEAPAPAADETLAAAAFVAAPMPQPAASAPAEGAAPIPFPQRRRNGISRLGEKPSSGHKRGLIAASIAVAVLVGGGVVAKTLLARPGNATPGVAQSLTSQAAASLGTAPSAAQPQVAVADSAAAAAPIVVPPLAPADTAGLTAAEKQKQEEDRRRLEEQRRLQQRQQDSVRQARLATAAAQPVTAAPQQVSLQNAPRPAPSVPAPQMEQRPVAPAASAPAPAAAAPARPAADPNRVYSAEELDSRPSLANAPAFRSAVSRSYPAALEGTNTWGSAVVSFVVRADGSVDRSSISVVEASHPAFRGAATAAIARARFTPARVGGQAVRTQVSMPITWRGGAQDDD